MMLDVRDLDAGYGDVQVLFGPSFSVAEGEIVALLGSNGAGKTTLIRVLCGLVRARRGALTFQGSALEGVSAHDVVERGIACVPEGRQVFPEMTVEENLLLGGFLRRARPRRKRNLERVYQVFPKLAQRRAQSAGTLSGGEQQMVAIGRALMSEPRLLVVDEMSLGMAPLLVDELFRVMGEIRAQGVTVLLVEQNAQKSLQLADRAYVLESGRVVLSGTGAELLHDDEVRKAYLAI
jgi:branched-chain amino acid transport system ATP-binding protein